MKIDKNETYEQLIARQKAERQAMKKRLAEQKYLFMGGHYGSEA